MDSGLPGALRQFDLTDRVAIVIGASSGLGAVLARRIGGFAVDCDLLDAAQVRTVAPRVVDGVFTGAVLWPAGDAGRFTTGQTVVVDGGWTAR